VSGQPIHQDGRGLVAELAFGPHALVVPHTNPNTTLFVVISGGGFVQVGDEHARVSHGEAVLWPAGELHGAWTDGTEMRAIVVEFTGIDDAWARGVLEAGGGTAGGEAAGAGDELLAPGHPEVERGAGSLAPPPPRSPTDRESTSGEPW
jgi:quercetin dioxygenase-like cupin family protein